MRSALTSISDRLGTEWLTSDISVTPHCAKRSSCPLLVTGVAAMRRRIIEIFPHQCQELTRRHELQKHSGQIAYKNELLRERRISSQFDANSNRIGGTGDVAT